MKMPRSVYRLIILGVAAGLSAASVFVCGETEEVLVTQFGRVVRVVGGSVSSAGLKFKAPWQGLVRVDRRGRLAELPPSEALTADKKNLEIGLSLVWRVKDARRFVESAAGPVEVESRLSERATSAIVEAVARQPMAAIVSTAADRPGPDALADQVMGTLNASAAESFGVEIAAVMVRRISYPTEIRPAVFEQIRAERAQTSSRIRAEAQAKAATVTAKSKRDRETDLTKARAEAEAIRSTAEAEALGILNEAHAQDPRLYELVRTLETYKTLADDKTTVILSSGSPLWKLLWQGPSVDFEGDSPPPPNLGPAPEPIGPSGLVPAPRREVPEPPK
jgi:membrane protease subunit HflC